jgi:hypothetical protein
MATKDVVEQTEEERVTQWRYDVLKEAGVRSPHRAKLAFGRADLHEIVKAKEAGCSDKLLMQIFGDSE